MIWRRANNFEKYMKGRMWIFLKPCHFVDLAFRLYFKTLIKCVFVWVEGADGGVRGCCVDVLRWRFQSWQNWSELTVIEQRIPEARFLTCLRDKYHTCTLPTNEPCRHVARHLSCQSSYLRLVVGSNWLHLVFFAWVMRLLSRTLFFFFFFL